MLRFVGEHRTTLRREEGQEGFARLRRKRRCPPSPPERAANRGTGTARSRGRRHRRERAPRSRGPRAAPAACATSHPKVRRRCRGRSREQINRHAMVQTSWLSVARRPPTPRPSLSRGALAPRSRRARRGPCLLPEHDPTPGPAVVDHQREHLVGDGEKQESKHSCRDPVATLLKSRTARFRTHARAARPSPTLSTTSQRTQASSGRSSPSTRALKSAYAEDREPACPTESPALSARGFSRRSARVARSPTISSTLGANEFVLFRIEVVPDEQANRLVERRTCSFPCSSTARRRRWSALDVEVSVVTPGVIITGAVEAGRPAADDPRNTPARSGAPRHPEVATTTRCAFWRGDLEQAQLLAAALVGLEDQPCGRLAQRPPRAPATRVRRRRPQDRCSRSQAVRTRDSTPVARRGTGRGARSARRGDGRDSGKEADHCEVLTAVHEDCDQA